MTSFEAAAQYCEEAAKSMRAAGSSPPWSKVRKWHLEQADASFRRAFECADFAKNDSPKKPPVATYEQWLAQKEKTL